MFGLAVMPDGRILAGDVRRGLVESGDGGTSWREVLPVAIVGLAMNPIAYTGGTPAHPWTVYVATRVCADLEQAVAELDAVS